MNTLNTEVTTPKATRKVVKVATKATKKAKASPKAKPVDDILGSYPKLKSWPTKCGEAPSRDLIIMARGLAVGRPGTKRELAVAAYLRDCAGSFNTQLVAAALQHVVGGTFNPMLNVVNRDVCSGMGLGKVIKAKVEGGTSYRLELNAKGRARVAKFMAAIAAVTAADKLDGTKGNEPKVPVEPTSEPSMGTGDPVEHGVDTERELAGNP